MTATSEPAQTSEEPKKPNLALATAQRLGRSLMLPIAALPIAGLLLRFGQEDLLGGVPGLETVAAVIGNAGGAIFDNLGLLFAVGIAFGFARKGDGSTALAGLVGYLVLGGVFDALSPVVLAGQTNTDDEQLMIDYGVLGGIVIGLTAALLYQRFYRTKLPTYLAFFGGRRLVPILTGLAAVLIGTVMGLIYPYFNDGLTAVGNTLTGSVVIGGGVYGVINRLLIPVGLHHILNSLVWFVFGDYQGAHGDLNRFFEGDPTAGSYMAGFFPILMFALPAAALAITHEAKPSQRKVVGGLMFSAALTVFITGVSEPLEFAFMFVALPLYVLHAILTGVSFVIVNSLGIKLGFTFSAGGIDFLLNYGQGTDAWMLIPIGLVFAVIYYVSFRFLIRKLNLPTPGRDNSRGGGISVIDDPTADSGGRT